MLSLILVGLERNNGLGITGLDEEWGNDREDVWLFLILFIKLK